MDFHEILVPKYANNGPEKVLKKHEHAARSASGSAGQGVASEKPSPRGLSRVPRVNRHRLINKR